MKRIILLRGWVFTLRPVVSYGECDSIINNGSFSIFTLHLT